MVPLIFATDPVELPLQEHLFNLSVYAVPGGIVGGVVYWWVVGRFLKRGESIAA
jgi:hypothetical protein